jgi:hypothetical protein
MNKIRSDATWGGLAAEHREMLEQWLFEENLSYEATRELAQKEFGFTGSTTSLGRFYQHRAKERLVKELEELDSTTSAVNQTKVNMGNLRGAALKVIGKRLFESAMGRGEPKDLEFLGRLLMQSEEHEIQRQWLALARDRFEFSAAEAVVAEMPKLGHLTDEDLEREKERMLHFKEKLFGPDAPE